MAGMLKVFDKILPTFTQNVSKEGLSANTPRRSGFFKNN